MTKYRSPSDIEMLFSPANWGYAMDNTEKAYKAECPTIYDYSEKFGIEYAVMWVRLQIMALYGSSPNKEKGVSDGIKLFCNSFTAQVKGFKLSELMLFSPATRLGGMTTRLPASTPGGLVTLSSKSLSRSAIRNLTG